MRKRLIKWVALISIPFGILFACKEYDEQGYPQKEPKLDRATEIANARTWYESEAVQEHHQKKTVLKVCF